MLRKLVMPTALYLFYILLSGSISVRVLSSGVVVTGLVVLVLDYFDRMEHRKPIGHISWWRIVWFFLIVLSEVFMAAYQHILRVISGDDDPVFFDVYLDVEEELAIMLIANAITLTPGTLTVQVSGQMIRIVGFAKEQDDVVKLARVVVRRFQRPFLYKKKGAA